MTIRKPTYADLERKIDELEKELAIRQQNEEVFVWTEELATSTIDALSAHICVLDEMGAIIAVNKTWRDFAVTNPPTPRNYLEGTHYLRVCDTAIGPDAVEAKAFAEGIRSVMRGECETFSLEYPCHSPTEERWFVGRVTRFLRKGISYIVVAHEDITKRKRIEEALHDANKKLTLAQQASGAGVWYWDIPAGKLDWSEGLFHLFGLTPTTSPPSFETWQRAVHPDDLKTAKEKIGVAMKQHTPLSNVHRIILPSGEERWINVLGDTTYNEKGKPIRMTGICIDITESKKAEEELRAKAKDLLVKTARLEELNTALRVILDQRDEEKKHFEDSVLSNVKTLVLPYLDRIESGALTEEARTYLGLARSNLTELVSPLAKRLGLSHASLTPTEIKVLDLIKAGRSNKDIAELLHVSPSAISFHRFHIRKKLGLINKKVNLRSFLATQA